MTHEEICQKLSWAEMKCKGRKAFGIPHGSVECEEEFQMLVAAVRQLLAENETLREGIRAYRRARAFPYSSPERVEPERQISIWERDHGAEVLDA